jgi:membrane-associated protease RseP (regulator of RpoE activity)
MLFMRPVIPMKDRFQYDEYYKLFFPEEFSEGVVSIFKDLIPKDLLEKTLKKVEEKKRATMDREKERELAREKEKEEHIRLLEQVNYDLNLDIEKMMTKVNLLSGGSNSAAPSSSGGGGPTAVESIVKKAEKIEADFDAEIVKIAGFRIIDLEPKDDESLGFDICMGPTGTFIMINYVEPKSLVEKLGMKVGDELVSVNETSFKMIELDQAIEV